MFLVIMRCLQDDLPLFISVDEAKAVAYARSADWLPDDRTCEIFHDHASSPICIDVVEFRQGKPWNSVTIKTFKEDEQSPPTLRIWVNDP